MFVPAGGWSSMKPNPVLTTMPDNTWTFLPCKFVPKGVTSFGDMKFGQDYGGFGHPKTEVVLVYDEARNVTVWFGGCSSGYTNQTVLMSVSDATVYQAQPQHVDQKRSGRDVPPLFATSRPHGQCSYGACYDSDHKLYIKGPGICSGWPYDMKTWAYDAAKNDWTALTGQAHGWCYKMVYDRSNKVAVVLGDKDRNNDTWLFDVEKRAWRKADVKGPTPPWRWYYSMVYDERNKKVVLFGGGAERYGSGKYHNDTWTFDAATSTWTEMKPATSPSARYMSAMAYDSTNGVCVLVGGKAHTKEIGPNPLRDTWVYDLARNEWTNMNPANQPPVYGIFQASYDRVNNVVVYPGRGGVYVYRYRNAK